MNLIEYHNYEQEITCYRKYILMGECLPILLVMKTKAD